MFQYQMLFLHHMPLLDVFLNARTFSLLDHDQVSWNSVIGALADSESSVSEAVKYFLNMTRNGWVPNRITFINILAAVSSLSLSKLSHQIHALVIKNHLANDSCIENALLACYGKMWREMNRAQKVDGFTFATILSACASVATLERGMEVHACAIRACLESDVVVGSAIVNMYSKCGRIDYSSRFFNMMPIRNVYSWNSMIPGYARHGHGDKALKLFKHMKLDGQLPDHVTFVGVLSACSHVELVDEGFSHFNSMKEVYGLAPKMEHFSCIVDLLAWAGVCRRTNGHKTVLGSKAAEMLFDLEPQNAVNYVLLA
ncbi:hypothetical protein CRYUN_Cryun23aG0046800 [Craigia yunnanensis]